MLTALALLLMATPQPPLVVRGFDHFYNLEYNEAIADFTDAARQDPQQPARWNDLAEGYLFREMFKAGALESEWVTGHDAFLRRPQMNATEEDQRKFDQAIERVMQLTEAALKRNPNDTRAIYAKGVAYGLRANYNFLVRRAWIGSLRDATTSRKLHTRVTELDPKFVDAMLVQGTHDYVVGSLPFYYRMLGFVAGFRGDKPRGIQELEHVRRNGDRNTQDAAILLAAIYRRERNPRAAIPLVEELIRSYPRNYLFRFELTQMYADAGNGTAALAVMDEAERLKMSGAPGYAHLPMEKILYARGTVQFWYRDYPHALENMLRVTAKAQELDLPTGVTAWLRLGQIYDLTGRRAEARQAYQAAIRYAPGAAQAAEAKQYLSRPYQRRAGT
jgi:tetratricopeptide (TPR) repeat protein